MRGRTTCFVLAGALLAGAVACEEQKAEGVVLGLLLSYTGDLAANSANSERAVLMAVEAVNTAGGIGGQPLRVMARDTHSDPRRIGNSARDLVAGNATIVLGPDNRDLATSVKAVLTEHTLILPSFTTASNFSKPHNWFVMGVPARRLACELYTRARADGWKNPMLIADPHGYSSLLTWELSHLYAIRRIILPTDGASDETTVQPIVSAGADAYIIAALPPSTSSLLYALAAVGALDNPKRFYLSPTLHTPALLATIPTGMLQGAQVVSVGTVAGAADFRAAFQARWQDTPLDDAYAFYDATAVAALALQRALRQHGTIPKGLELAEHVRAVTHANGIPVQWNEIARALELLRQGQEVEYMGPSGLLQFDLTGQTPGSNTAWWTVGANGFVDAPANRQPCM